MSNPLNNVVSVIRNAYDLLQMPAPELVIGSNTSPQCVGSINVAFTEVSLLVFKAEGSDALTYAVQNHGVDLSPDDNTLAKAVSFLIRLLLRPRIEQAVKAAVG